MPTRCASPIKGTHLRVIRLDECGVPVTGAAAVVTTGFVQVQASPQYEDGEEFLVKNAAGDACVNDVDDDLLKRFDITIDLCSVDPDMAEMVLGTRRLTTGSPVTGTGFAVAEGTNAARFSVEVWQRVAGAGACDASGAQQYIYNAWPNVGSAKIGDYTIENGVSQLQLIGKSKAASPLWTAGADWLDAGGPEADEHWLWNITTVAPPDAACGAVVVA